MEKEQSQNNPKNISEKEEEVKASSDQTSENSQTDESAADGSSQNLSEEAKDEEKSPEEKILELEDKLARTFAEMENQRRRFEKEKEDAYEYGGFAFAKEALNLIDNLERSKQILSNDESLKNSESFNDPSLFRICFDLSRLSIRLKASFAKAKPPYSKASSFSFSNLLL